MQRKRDNWSQNDIMIPNNKYTRNIQKLSFYDSETEKKNTWSGTPAI